MISTGNEIAENDDEENATLGVKFWELRQAWVKGTMEGISLDFHCFNALNNNLETQLFLHVHFYASSDLLMACRTMQLRFF